MTLKIGLIREGKVPADNRVALTPAQCRWLLKTQKGLEIFAQSSPTRCFPDIDYTQAGVVVQEDMAQCDILLGIKEVPVDMLIPQKTYLFFSHTKKLQEHNRKLMRTIIEKKITLIDYECLEHDDGARIIGFGFFAGVVGAHNGIRAYGLRTKAFKLDKVNPKKNLQHLFHTYFGLKVPNIKIAVTGSGRVSHGLLEVMNLLEIREVDPQHYVDRDFPYPVFVHLKGGNLYEKENGEYNRDEFHKHPELYRCKFPTYIPHTDILMNGVYWDKNIPRLFSMADLKRPDFRIQTIADITDDFNGSVPCNLGDSSIDDPVYGVDRISGEKTAPYLPGSIDIMAVGNLPNELPRDASRYFGEQMIKFVLGDLLAGGSELINRATIAKDGKLNTLFDYMSEYAGLKRNGHLID